MHIDKGVVVVHDLLVPVEVYDLIEQAAKRDARLPEHIMNTALREYVDSRKLKK